MSLFLFLNIRTVNYLSNTNSRKERPLHAAFLGKWTRNFRRQFLKRIWDIRRQFLKRIRDIRRHFLKHTNTLIIDTIEFIIAQKNYVMMLGF